jgi:predicted flap endonuclease-1-like 5' DNA nuclease
MFGLDPFSRPVAIIEILLLLALAAFVGWLIARLLLNSRVNALQAAIADKEAELENCRRSKAAVKVPANTIRTEVVVPATVTEPLIVPVMSAPVLEVPVELPPVLVSTVIAPVTEPVQPIISEPVIPSVSVATPPGIASEDDVLTRIAARAGEVNFDRIGRAMATEADDLKDIVGVGPFLERKLHSLGIYTFRQVGNFAKEDIDKVNELIEFFPGRIERDNWVSQAQAFHEQKYGRQIGE